MGGLKGISRVQQDDPRARRNAARLALALNTAFGDGFSVGPGGKLEVDASALAGLGLEVVGGKLQIKLADGTLTLDANGLSVTVPAPESLDDLDDVTLTGPQTDDYLRFNGTQFVNTPFPDIPEPSEGGTANITWNEIPTGTINGANDTFTLSDPVKDDHIILTLNGLTLLIGTDYTAFATEIVFDAAVIPQTGDRIITTYEPEADMFGLDFRFAQNSGYLGAI